MLTKQALEEYKEIHREETCKVFTDEVLLDEAINLLTLFDRVYRPIKKVWLKEYEQRTRNIAGMAKRETKVAGQDGTQSESEKHPSSKAD